MTLRTMATTLASRGELAHEGLVDLDLVDRAAPQQRERRVSGAEVVERDLDPELARRGDLARGVHVGEDRGLGDLDPDQVRVATGALEQAGEPLGRSGARELVRRDVAPDPEVVGDADRGEPGAGFRRALRTIASSSANTRPASSASGTNVPLPGSRRRAPSGPAPRRRRCARCAAPPPGWYHATISSFAIASRSSCSSPSRRWIASRNSTSKISMRFRPPLLGPVLRGVGVREQHLGVVGGVEVRRDADARGGVEAPARDLERRDERFGDALGDHHRFGAVVEPVEQHRELVAAEAGEHVVAAHDRLHPVRDLDEQRRRRRGGRASR